jgi:hypothetical protein
VEQINKAAVAPGPKLVGQPATIQVVDPLVSQQKFEQETRLFLDAQAIHRKRGIIVLDCSFPDIKIAFCAPQIKPSPIVFAVNINFTNYDLDPLSVKFINPFTNELITYAELNHEFKRKKAGVPPYQPLCLHLNNSPFICLPGIREYHMHPDHSNDPWLTHRGKGGEGNLGFIIDKLWEYGIQALTGFQLQINATAPQLHLAIDPNKVPT